MSSIETMDETKELWPRQKFSIMNVCGYREILIFSSLSAVIINLSSSEKQKDKIIDKCPRSSVP